MPLNQQVGAVVENSDSEEFLVICLCAEWCGTCRDYKAGFTDLAAKFPEARFRWLDIEEHADDLGDLDIENFPTLFIQRRETILFFGTMLPHLSLLQRLIETYRDQTPEQSRDYGWSNPERQGWQENQDLCRLWQVVAP